MTKILSKSLASVLVLALAFVVFGSMNLAQAAGVASFSDTMTRQKVSELSDHTIEFTIGAGTTIDAGETITVALTSGDGAEFFDPGSVAFGDIDLEFSTSTDATLAAAASATDWGVAIAGGSASNDLVFTFTAPSTAGTYVTAGETITIEIGTVAGGANQITNPATSSEDAAGGNLGAAENTRYMLTVGGTFGDAGTAILPILEDDQVMVTALVQPELIFELHSDDDDQTNKFFDVYSNVVDLGTLSSAAIRFATIDAASGGSATAPTGGAHGFRAATNSAGGYTVTVAGSTLTNGSGDTIDAIGATAAASAPGTEQFGLCLTDDTTGTAGTSATVASLQGQIDTQYDCGAGYSFDDSGAADTIATGNAGGPTSATFYDVDYISNISPLTESGNYMAILTYIATGLF